MKHPLINETKLAQYVLKDSSDKLQVDFLLVTCFLQLAAFLKLFSSLVDGNHCAVKELRL